MHRTYRVPRAPLGAALLLGLFFGGAGICARAQEGTAPAAKSQRVINLGVGATQPLSLTTKEPIAHVRNDKDQVVQVITGDSKDPTFVLIKGLSPGTAHLEMMAAKDDKTGKTTVEAVEVNVALDIDLLKNILAKAVPTASVVPIPGAGNTIILTGNVAHAEDIDTVMGIARSITAGGATPANIVNAMRIGGVMQVQLDVVVAFVDRTAVRQMAIDMWDAGQHHDLTNSVGGSILLPQNISGQVPPVTSPVTFTNIIGTPNGANFNTFFDVINGRQAFFLFLQALKNNQLGKIMAEPHLVTLSGRPANFLSGGEQAVPEVSGFGATAGVNFVPFGVRVQFLPIVLGNGKIYMELEPEVTELTAVGGFAATGNIPAVQGRTVQRVRTSVMMEDGQTFAIGGLIFHTDTAAIRRVPVLGDLPFVGTFFSAKEYIEDEQELVVLVTPHLVDPMDCCQVPHYLPGQETRAPDDFELFLENILEAPRGSREVNHDRRYVPAWKNSPTAAAYPCVSSAQGGNGAGGGITLPHEILNLPGPVPPLPGNVVVDQGAPMSPEGVQPAGAVLPAEGVPSAGPPSGRAPGDAAQPGTLPPVQAVPLDAGTQR
jgi:pilus assembly protein CpaC